ncbi:MAG: twin-arginine translocase TatA/TatE family subunit [Phycisphaeraceae bacterium]
MMLTPDNLTFAMFGPIGMPELVILAFLGLLIFGKRLPEIGKSLGKGIVSFKKGLQGVQDDIETSVNKADDDVQEPRKLESKSPSKASSEVVENDEARV